MNFVSYYRQLFALWPKSNSLHAVGWCRCSNLAPKVRLRFAPSPTGHLHLGGLRTALYNYLFSRSQKGKFILRIEDTDQTRLVPGAVEQLVEMLSWTGIEIDEGPYHGGHHGPYIQSERLALYKEHAERLVKNGSAYRCFCTSHRLDLIRKQAATRGEVPKYDNRCRHLTSEEVEDKLSSKMPFVIRFKLEPFTDSWSDLVYGPIFYDVAKIEGDPVLMKSDGFPTYHLANVVDDHLMEISHVLRGVEWQVSTTKHILLYKAFDWQPPLFAHLPLLQNKDGKKLSKRQNDVHVEYYKNAGYFPEAVLNLITNMGSGFTVRQTAGMNMKQLIEHFDLSKLNTNSTRVDFDKIIEFNQLHLKEIINSTNQTNNSMVQELRTGVLENLTWEDSNSCMIENLQNSLTDDYLMRVLKWSKERISLVSDLFKPEYSFLWSLPPSATFHVKSKEFTISLIQDTITFIAAIDNAVFSQGQIAATLNTVCHNKQLKFSEYMQFLRKSLTGCLQGPSIAEIITILGKETTLSRLNHALKSLSSTEQKAEILTSK